MDFKKQSNRAVFFSVFLICAMLALSPKAYAYLDPGLGSFLLQMLVAGLVGVVVAVRGFWGNLRGFFGRFKKPPKENQS